MPSIFHEHRFILDARINYNHNVDLIIKIHCSDKSFEIVNTCKWFQIFPCLLNKYLSYQPSKLCILVPSHDSLTISKLNQLINHGNVVADNPKELQVCFKKFGGTIVKRNSNEIVVSFYGRHFSKLINISSISNCPMENILENINQVIYCLPDGESSTEMEKCGCNRNECQAQAESSQPPEHIAKLKGSIPLMLNSDNHILTGKITSSELLVEAWPPGQQLINNFTINMIAKIRITKAIKIGLLPSISIHNLSQLITSAPCTGRTANSVHFCIFCGSQLKNRVNLIYHIQKYHTSFWCKCNECGHCFPDEINFKRHSKRIHEKVTEIGYMCQGSNAQYTEESVKAGLEAASVAVNIDNKFTQNTKKCKNNQE